MVAVVGYTEAELTELWHLFILGGRCPCHRSRLMAAFYPMTKRIAGSFRKRSGTPIDYDELVSWGTFGLVHAIDTWDPNRNVRFESWAAVQVRGRILDEVRTQDWAPRTVRRRQRELDLAYEHLIRDLGREPTMTELAGVIQTSEFDIITRFHETEAARIRSLDESLDPENEASAPEPIDHRDYGHDDVENRDLMERMVKHIAVGLDTTSRAVLTLYYYEGLSLEQIARVTGLAEHRVSQVHMTTVLLVREAVREMLTPESVAS